MVEERHLKRLKGEPVVSTYSFRVVTKNGELIWCQLNTTLINWQGRPATLNIVRDITQQKQMEEKLVKNAAQLTGQLLGFARKGKYQAVPSDLNQILDSNAAMFGRTKKKFEPKLQLVDVDRRQMEQVLLNIFVNAGQAMPDGGELHLQTDNVTLDEIYASAHEVTPGPYVKISIRDTGVVGLRTGKR